MFPSDAILIARGKYATLSKERRRELKIARETGQNLMNAASQIMRDLETEPPVNGGHVEAAQACINTLSDCQAKLGELGAQMQELLPQAWE